MLIYVAEEMKLATSVRPAARYCSLRRSRTASYEGSAPATTMSSSSHALSYATYRGDSTLILTCKLRGAVWCGCACAWLLQHMQTDKMDANRSSSGGRNMCNQDMTVTRTGIRYYLA